MSRKIEFVEREAKGETISALCRECGVSRTTGHKWVKRFKERGHDGLEEESRRPKSAPLATAEDVVMAVLEARDAHPRWGPRKLEILLRRRFGEQTPSERTIARILKRANKVRRRRRERGPDAVHRAPDVRATCPNEVWTMDFKGWWKVLDGERCEPLTVRDAYSRFVLSVLVCRPKTHEVKAELERLFAKYGVPNVIQFDNGPPFVSVQARAGISRLSAWLMSLGIRIVRSRPGCPQDNGGHERMHADMSGDVQSRPGQTVADEQRRLSRWRQEFNHVRPHEALGGKVPADVYKVLERKRPARADYVYPAHMFARPVYTSGALNFMSEELHVGTVFAGYSVGIEVIDAMHVRAWYRHVDLGLIETSPQVDDALFEASKSSSRRDREMPSKIRSRRKLPPPAGAAAAMTGGERSPSSRPSSGDGVAL